MKEKSSKETILRILSFRVIITLITISLSVTLFSQEVASDHLQKVNDNGVQGITVDWTFAPLTTHPLAEDEDMYQFIRIKGFTHTKDVGKPALPTINELIAIPKGSDVNINIIESEYIDLVAEYPVYPALEPATDTYGAPEPDFIIDEGFYQIDQFSPNELIALEGTHQWRDLGFGIFNITPVQYNPVRKIIRVYTRIHFAIEFTGGTEFIDVEQHSDHFLSMVAKPFLNSVSIQNEVAGKSTSANSHTNVTPNYIIVSHATYMSAAERLAAWKEQLGHVVELLDGTNMTYSQIRNEVHNRYNAWTPKPDFFLIIGDHPDIPGLVKTGSYGTYATDLFYVCMGGGNDFVPDMAKGRISVATATQAENVVNKIIQYEMNPPSDTTFFTKGLHAAYFQHAGGGYAQRRFAQTSEEIRNYMTTVQNFDVTRVYVTGSSVNPMYWNNGLYSAGEPIPTYLRKPTFPWTGNASDISATINSGVSYVLHRDHGFETGWGDPYYNNSHISALNNSNKTPIVMTINCLTGKFYHSECFAERFLRKYPGGAVGVIGHAEVSFSGWNDALAFGFFDAIWSSPGLIPNFTGSGGNTIPTPPPHAPILTMGDVANHGLLRMTQTWGTSQYTNELLHYFGDPSMRIYTRVPTHITASHVSSIACGSDTSMAVFSPNSSNGVVTISVDGEVVGRGDLVNGAHILTFPQLSGTHAVITIHDSNAVPYIDTIIITGGCPKSMFTHQAVNYCLAETIVFENESTGNINTYQWDFGAGAVPATAIGAGPHNVNYNSSGTKTISLTVSGTTGSHSSTKTIIMDSICHFRVPTSGSKTITHCTGILQDDGGDNDYSNSTNGIVTISPSGAASVSLFFTEFSFEDGNDFVHIYDGPNVGSPLIGSYTGHSLPGNNGLVVSTTGSITIRQVSNTSITFPGFSLKFHCVYPNSPPITNFIITDSTECSGEITFTDLSISGPTSWYWEFGDGNSSIQQNPTHNYMQNGVFDIKLITANVYGIDTLIKHEYVNIDIPLPPVVDDVKRCNPGTVTFEANISGTGVANWYDVPTGGTPIHTGSTFTTPHLNNSNTYYVESEHGFPTKYGGKPNNAGGGGNMTYSHYLIFDAYKPFKLKSVRVYAQGSGNRTIQLANSSGAVIESATINIPDGMSRITLDFDVPADNNLRLVCAGSPHLYRNNAGINYPYTLPGVLSIHSSSASSNPLGFYYFFYSWEIQEESCFSPRIDVEAIVSDTIIPNAQFSYTQTNNQVQFTNESVFADSYLWSFGDGNFSTDPDPVHIYNTPGLYTATLYAMNDCGTDSLDQVIDITTGIYETKPETGIYIYPNPAYSNLNIEIRREIPGDYSAEIFDISGRLIKSVHKELTPGINDHMIDISAIPSGVYLLRISGHDLNHTERIIVAP